MKRSVCDVGLGRRGGSNYGEGGKGMRSCGPATSQILGPPGTGFSHLILFFLFGNYLVTTVILLTMIPSIQINEPDPGGPRI